MQPNTIINTNALAGLQTLPDNCIDCCVTSPPYWGLRDYGTPGQLGLEPTPEEYITKLTEIFNQVKRTLKPAGTLWLNLGDSYAGSGKGKGDTTGDKWKQATNKGSRNGTLPTANLKLPTIKAKDLIGIPWLAAFALRAAGWYLRQDIIWHKRNPMPESVTDRCTKAHEYIFLLTKSQKYFYDAEAIKEPASENTNARVARAKMGHKTMPDALKNGIRPRKLAEPGSGIKSNSSFEAALTDIVDERNKRDVWTVTTQPFPEAHFATFPETLIVDCIKAGCPEHGLVLDPFMGAGTTGLVARKLNRNYLGFEINPAYIRMAERRIRNGIGLFV